MSEIIQALEVNLRYAKRFIPENENIDVVLTKEIVPGERSAYDIIIHGLKPMYQRAYADLNSISELKDIDLPINSKLGPREQIFETYENTLKLFTQARNKFDADMDYIVNEEYQQTRSKQYATVGMHTIHHLGQAIGICNIQLRQIKTEN